MHYPMRPFNSAETNASHYVAHLVREYPTLSLDDLTRKALAANPYKTEKTRSIFEKMVFSCVRKEENKRVPAEPVTQAVVEPVVEQLPPPRVQHVVTYWEGDSTKTIATMAASFDEARDNFLVGYPTLTIIKIECPLNPVYDETPIPPFQRACPATLGPCHLEVCFSSPCFVPTPPAPPAPPAPHVERKHTTVCAVHGLAFDPYCSSCQLAMADIDPTYGVWRITFLDAHEYILDIEYHTGLHADAVKIAKGVKDNVLAVASFTIERITPQ